jgi:hypothetical protein
LIDDMQEVGAEINAIADAAEGITREAVDEKVQALIDQTVEEYRHKGQRPADELEKRRQRNARDAEREAQQHIAEVKRLAASE